MGSKPEEVRGGFVTLLRYNQYKLERFPCSEGV